MTRPGTHPPPAAPARPARALPVPEAAAEAGAAPPSVAVIGRGYSGIAAAITLLYRLEPGCRLTLIDGNFSLGGGAAYGRLAHPDDLLNVRARDLSVLPDREGDFADWIGEQTLGRPARAAERAEIGDRFMPRAFFATYVSDRFDEARIRAPGIATRIEEREARSLVPAPGGGWDIRFTAGPPVRADVVILATGYGTGRQPRRFGMMPYQALDPDSLRGLQGVMIVGSGLTMVDTLLRLRRAGVEAAVTIVSRRGILPQPHCPSPQRPPAWQVAENVRLHRLFRDVRAACRRALAEGRSWQGELNRLRPHAQDIWRTLPDGDRQRFVRHVKSLWDAHRHRLPPETHAALSAELALGRTTHRAGRVLSVEGAAPARVAVRWRGSRTAETLAADIVIDCTGFAPDIGSDLVRGLIADRHAMLDSLGIGLRVAPDGRIVSPRTGDFAGLFALGPLGQGSLLEITAAPEILRQAGMAATTIRDHLAHRARAAGPR